MMSPGLTSFRFFAFFAVYLFHAMHFHAGYLGVSAFFVLSGFLLTAILVEMKDSHEGKEYFVQFYARRTLRIFPLYYFYLFIIALTGLLFSVCAIDFLQDSFRVFFQQLPWALTYTYNVFNASDEFVRNGLISHFWSLATEEQFYLVWPLAIYFTPKRYIKSFLLFVIILGPILRYLTACAVEQQWIPGIGTKMDFVVYVGPLSHFDAFAIGGYFALYGRSGSTGSVVLLTTLVIAIGILSAHLNGGNTYWPTLGYHYFMDDSFKYIWGYTLLSFLFGHILVTIREGKLLPHFLALPWLVYLGTISYGLYVYHVVVLHVLVTAFPAWVGPVSAVIGLVMTIIISAASYRWIEQPFIRMKDRWFARDSKK